MEVIGRTPRWYELIAQNLGQGLGQGIQTGLSSRLQMNKNVQAGFQTGKQLGMNDQEAVQFANYMSSIPAEKQAGVFKDLMEGRLNQAAMQGYLNPQQQRAEQFETSKQDQFRENQQPRNFKINGIEFNENELPQRKNITPPIGPLKDISNQQFKQSLQDQKRIDEFAKPYEDVNKLQQYHKDMTEISRLVNSGKLDVNFLQKIAIAVSKDASKGELSRMFKSAGIQELESLVVPNLKSKDLGGSNPSTQEVIMKSFEFPSSMNTKEANQYIAKRLEANSAKNLHQAKVIGALRKYDKNMSYEDFKDALTNKMERYEEKNIGEKQIPRAAQKGQKPPDNVVDLLVKKHGKNIPAIREEIEQLGYEF